MPVIRNIISKVMPKSMAAAAETESKQWMIRCDSCGYEQSVWDAGGMRYKAAGEPHVRRKCAGCGKTGWHTIVKRQDAS